MDTKLDANILPPECMSAVACTTALLLRERYNLLLYRNMLNRMHSRAPRPIALCDDLRKAVLSKNAYRTLRWTIRRVEMAIEALSTTVLALRQDRRIRRTGGDATHVGYLSRHVNVAVHSPIRTPAVLNNNVLLLAGRYAVPNRENSMIKHLRATLRR